MFVAISFLLHLSNFIYLCLSGGRKYKIKPRHKYKTAPQYKTNLWYKTARSIKPSRPIIIIILWGLFWADLAVSRLIIWAGPKFNKRLYFPVFCSKVAHSSLLGAPGP